MRGVVKRFASALAVNGLELEVPSGLCYGLLGPNGAGKSTTMRILTGQVFADAGDIEVLGYRLPAESKLARARMGVCPQESNLDVDLRVRDVLAVFARLYRVPASQRAGAVERALALAGLHARAEDRAVTLSGGMQRRLLIARALIHDPVLVLLDEPTVGLDPQVRQELWSLILKLREQGATVLMSTHYIEEAERLADRVAIMSAGSVVAEGTPAELIREHAGRQVVDVHGSAAELRLLQERALRDGLPTRQSGPALTYLHAEAADGRVPAGRRRSATLEDVFVRLTGDYVE
jgi:lipooligosaccharide transport system ATP-binding protein